MAWPRFKTTYSIITVTFFITRRLYKTVYVRWTSGVHLKNKTASVEFNSRLGIECITNVARRSRPCWFGHVERKDKEDWVSTYRCIKVEGVRDRGRKTWSEGVK